MFEIRLDYGKFLLECERVLCMWFGHSWCSAFFPYLAFALQKCKYQHYVDKPKLYFNENFLAAY